MFNSIRKDISRRKLVKKFEIQKLQNKVILQAIPAIDNNVSLQRRSKEDKTFCNLNSFHVSLEVTQHQEFLRKSSLYLFAKRKKAGYNKTRIDTKIEQDLSISKILKDQDNALFQSDSLFTSKHNNNFQDYNLKSIILNKRPIPRNGSKIRVQNRCIETGRSRSVLKFCKLSRICLREKASKGLISGMKKASW